MSRPAPPIIFRLAPALHCATRAARCHSFVPNGFDLLCSADTTNFLCGAGSWSAITGDSYSLQNTRGIDYHSTHMWVDDWAIAPVRSSLQPECRITFQNQTLTLTAAAQQLKVTTGKRSLASKPIVCLWISCLIHLTIAWPWSAR